MLVNKTFKRVAAVTLVLGSMLFAATAQADGPFQYYTLTPCRVFDTRTAGGPTSGVPLSDSSTTTFVVQGICEIPLGAKAITVNITAVSPTGQGHFRVFPSGLPLPLVSTLNFPSGSGALGNGAIIPLADQGVEPEDMSVFTRVVGSGTVHMVLDVTGYFQ
jgi:hypothetical protein